MIHQIEEFLSKFYKNSVVVSLWVHAAPGLFQVIARELEKKGF
jgi:hypothetical protein